MSTTVEFRVAKEWSIVKVKMTKAGTERKARLEAAGKCLACEIAFAENERKICGVHLSCDQTQRYAIRTGKTTLRELIRDGERLAATQGGRKPATKYAARLLGREGEERPVKSAS